MDMKLSDTVNPRTGGPFTREQMAKGAERYGLTWRSGDDPDPALSPSLVAAVNEVGWSDPNATLRRASLIQAGRNERRDKASAPALSWLGGIVWVRGEVRRDLDAFKVSQLPGRVGDAGHGYNDSPDMAEVEKCVLPPPPPQRPKTTQTWDDPDSDTPNYS